MDSPALAVGIILASVREGRRGEAFGRWIFELMSQRPDLKTELLDLKEWPLPGYHHKDPPAVIEKSYPEELARRWSEKIHALDGFVIVSPEYNHGYPGQLKNALDHVYRGWSYKPMAFVSYGGIAGGARAVEQLRQVAVELRMVPIRDEVNVRLIALAADDRGWPTDELYAKRAAAMINELVWWTRLVKEGRDRHPH